jgi:hypothetical protein
LSQDKGSYFIVESIDDDAYGIHPYEGSIEI